MSPNIIRDLVLESLLVRKKEISPSVAIERANNIAQGLHGLFNFVPLGTNLQQGTSEEYATRTLEAHMDKERESVNLGGSNEVRRAFYFGALAAIAGVKQGYDALELVEAFWALGKDR